eukprot:gnl/Hemi2/7923_TR2735_c0_g1_i1.p1 gnl/Hemi2/7923_TR2735_c0_g1~~gnl/Hemi2/7923_TR2735_c0_g1_i1.p1  ORF type:complete len:594 (+),score=103.91 gnl/Hemi2/7923_TR2735_c0_g1_i1:155-1936(+)
MKRAGDEQEDETGIALSSYIPPIRPASEAADCEAVNVPEVEIPSDDESAEGSKAKFSFRKLWAFTGPGFLMSIAYLDPGNLESDLQAGGVGGYSLIWVLFWATVMGLFFQVLSTRLGVVRGRHLAQVCHEKFPGPPRIILWLMTEVAIIGSDIQEVVGSAIAMQLLFGLPLWAGVLITGLDTFTFLWLHAYGIRKLEAFFGILIGTMCICFFAEFVIGEPDFGGILGGLVVPRLGGDTILQAVGMVGAVIMPHNIYLHSALVQSRKVDTTNSAKVREANYYYRIESTIALCISFFINLCVVAVFAKAFYRNDAFPDVGLSTAGTALEATLGKAAMVIWAVGLLASGQSSTMTGTYAGQFVMEGFLELKMPAWKRVLITRSIAIVPAVAVALMAEQNLDSLNELLNVLQSVQLPFALLPVLRFVSSEEIMGSFVLSKKLQGLAWTLGLMVIAFNVYLVGHLSASLPESWWIYALLILVGLLYFAFLLYVAFHPLHSTAVSPLVEDTAVREPPSPRAGQEEKTQRSGSNASSTRAETYTRVASWVAASSPSLSPEEDDGSSSKITISPDDPKASESTTLISSSSVSGPHATYQTL